MRRATPSFRLRLLSWGAWVLAVLVFAAPAASAAGAPARVEDQALATFGEARAEISFPAPTRHAVEARDEPASLLSELQAAMEEARDRPQDESHAEAVRDLAVQLAIPLVEAERALAGLEAQPTVTRELIMGRIAEAWLEGQRGARGLRRKTENP